MAPVTKKANSTCSTHGGGVRQPAAPERVNVRFVVGIEWRASVIGRPFTSFYSAGLKKLPVRIRKQECVGALPFALSSRFAVQN
jgi:hypothetical protein